MVPVIFLILEREPEPEDTLCHIFFLISGEQILAGNLLTAVGNEIDPISFAAGRRLMHDRDRSDRSARLFAYSGVECKTGAK